LKTNTKTGLVLVAVLLLSPVTTVWGESGQVRPSVFSDYLHTQAPASFLTIPGLSFDSSVGFTFFSSGDMGSVGMGYYLGHFGLKLSNSVMLHWDVGVGSVMRGAGEYGQPEFFIPNAELTYRPSESLTLRLQFQQGPWPGLYRFHR
jgi:hypothetical protein